MFVLFPLPFPLLSILLRWPGTAGVGSNALPASATAGPAVVAMATAFSEVGVVPLRVSANSSGIVVNTGTGQSREICIDTSVP